MASITQALRTAQSGLLVSQQTLNVVANNIANVNTPGYSRKIVSAESQVVNGTGIGVSVSEVSRLVDEGLLKSIRIEQGELTALSAQGSYYTRTQDLFGSPGENTSLSHIIDEFVSSLESLSTASDKTIQQAEVLRRAQDVVLTLQDMSATIQELRLQADVSIAEAVTEMSKITARIDELNDSIISNSATNKDVTDLRDQRDLQLDALSKMVDIRYFSRSDGDVVVFTSGGRTLVDTVPPTITHTPAATLSATSTHAEGDINGIYVGSLIASNDMTTEILGGAIKGLIDIRDTVLTNMQSQLDEFAGELRNVFNTIHNQGAPFPGLQSYSGSRTFVRPTEQTMTFANNDDTTVTLFDSSGNQTAQTTIRNILGGANTSSTTISNLASTMQTWLQDNGAANATVAVSNSGNIDIGLNTTLVNLTFRDESATANGSTLQNATITYDANGDGTTDETVTGFSNLLGLNDFFVDGLAENIYDSNVLVSSFSASASTLTFRDSTGTLSGSPMTVAAGTTLSALATQINNDVTNVTATVVPDGSGVRLRIAHGLGSSMTLTQASGNSFLTDIGMHLSDSRVASSLNVRSDIASTPANISSGRVQWDANKGTNGEYFMAVGENSVIEALAEEFTSTNSFDTAGGLSTVANTFSQYASRIVSDNSRLADTNEQDTHRQRSLTESLQFKSDTIRGVNLDEEMSNLIVFEQAFNASARVLSIVQRMLDTLEDII